MGNTKIGFFIFLMLLVLALGTQLTVKLLFMLCSGYRKCEIRIVYELIGECFVSKDLIGQATR